MDVGIYNIKFNRPMYSLMYASFVSGLKRHGVRFHLYNTADKNFLPSRSHDLAVTFTNIPRAKRILDIQKKHNNKFLTLYIGAFCRSGIVNFRNRNKVFGWDTKTKPTEDALLYCDLLSDDYMTHSYYKGRTSLRLEELNNFGIEMKPWKTDGYILIPEQVHPEGMGHGRSDWLEWAKETCFKIKSVTDRPIRIRRHPNRTAWKDYRKNIIKDFDCVEFSDGADTPLSDDLKGAYSMVTLSSRCVIEAITHGVRSVTEDKNSLMWEVSSTIESVENTTGFDRRQWLSDIAYSHWSIEEIANGDYWDYYKGYCGENIC